MSSQDSFTDYDIFENINNFNLDDVYKNASAAMANQGSVALSDCELEEDSPMPVGKPPTKAKPKKRPTRSAARIRKLQLEADKIEETINNTSEPAEVSIPVLRCTRQSHGFTSAPSASIGSDGIGRRGRGRGRGRNRVASRENAVTQNTIETIDLISSPLLYIPGVISLDSDEEIGSSKTLQETTSALSSSFSEENAEITIKIKWNNEVLRFIHRKHQKFEELIKQIADRENELPKHIYFTMNDYIIRPEDTPDSIGYSVVKFITGRVLRKSLAGVSAKKPEENSIVLKIQASQWKKPMLLSIVKTDALKIAYIKCAEELKCDPETIRLKFDGDTIDLHDTPANLDFEGGEVIDCITV